MSASSDLSNLIRPTDLTTARLSGTVRAARGGGFEVQLTGELAGERKYVNGPEMLPGRSRIDGMLWLDQTGRPDRLLIVGSGSFKMPWDRSDRPTASVAEWRAKPTSADH